MKCAGYYRIVSDPKATDHWYLGAPMDSRGAEIDPRKFIRGMPVGGIEELRVRIRKFGRQVDFNFADFDMPVVHNRLIEVISQLSGATLQTIKASVEGVCGENFEVVNACDIVDCVDESKSRFTKWEEGDGRPEKVGQYRMISELWIKPSIAAGHHFFRIAGWPIALIASAQMKADLESSQPTGISFTPVS